jgi:Phosphatidylserine/phosphatidylglycerophosphate/cardiolipin synthases and related enzymes
LSKQNDGRKRGNSAAQAAAPRYTVKNYFRKAASFILIGAVIGAGGVYAAMPKTTVPPPASVSGAVSNAMSEIANSFTPQSAVSTKAGTVSYYFPRAGQNAESALVSVVGSAKKSLDTAIYSFTDADVAAAMIADKQRGVKVRVITDRECAGNQYQARVLGELKDAGIPVKYNTHSGLMHMKVSIVDSATVTTGSFNYTKSAENENDEVLVILKNSTAAKDFGTQFARMWNDTKDFANY